jgi:lipopolysaccharide transport system permease protein
VEASSDIADAPATPHVRVIEAPRGLSFPKLSELWAHRDLLYLLSRRDLTLRYRQSAVGPFWMILEPLLLAGVFSVFFGLLQKVDGPPGIPYPLFAASALVLWLYFANALSTVAASTVGSPELISKIYFPRIIIPVAALLPALVGFAAGFLVVLALAVAYGFVPVVQVLLIPLLALLTAALALGFGLWFSAINVRYRDVSMLVPFLLLVGLFASPIIYPLEVVEANAPESLQFIYGLNPMAGILEAYRWMLLDTEFPGTLLLVPIVVSTVLLVTGAAYFQRAAQNFADLI